MLASIWGKDTLQNKPLLRSIFQNRDQQTTSTSQISPTAYFCKYCFVGTEPHPYLHCATIKELSSCYRDHLACKALYRKFTIILCFIRCVPGEYGWKKWKKHYKVDVFGDQSSPCPLCIAVGVL